jgi:hypothetical protein
MICVKVSPGQTCCSEWYTDFTEEYSPHYNGINHSTKELTMNTIQIFDPAMCCNTGVCGVDVDQQLVSFSVDVDWAKSQGVDIVRFNLAQQPMAFAENPTVKGFLERSGQEGLPLILVNGEIALAGRYPVRAELARWAGLGISLKSTSPAPISPASTGGCCGGKGGCGSERC